MISYFDRIDTTLTISADSLKKAYDGHRTFRQKNGFSLSPRTFYVHEGSPFFSVQCPEETFFSGVMLILSAAKYRFLTKVQDFEKEKFSLSDHLDAKEAKTRIAPLRSYPCSSASLQSSLRLIIRQLIQCGQESDGDRTLCLFARAKIQEFLSYYLVCSRNADRADLSKNASEAEQKPNLHSIKETEQENIQRVMNYIQTHPFVHLSGEELVREARMSLAKLKICFKELTGMTMSEYRDELRLQKACTFLRETGMSIQEIAQECGFKTVISFDAFFKQKTGITPSRFRKNYQNT